jgi:glycosyltransferase involved in cell wall biosynthesis
MDKTKKMKSLLMITTVPDTLKAFLLPFARHFRTQGWRVDAIACGIYNSPECLEMFDNVWDVEWSRNPLDPKNLLVAPSIIREVIQKGKYDIVHVHTPVAAFVSRYALKNCKYQPKPTIIYTAHGFHFHSGGQLLKNSVFMALEKLAGHWTDYLVVINREDEQAAKRFRLVSPERIRYMPGIGVDLKYYSSDTTSDIEVEKFRQELGIAPDTSIFVSVAELIERKRPQDILKAFASLNHPKAYLAFAGDGILMEQMQQLAFQLGIQDKVCFLGFRKDIPTLIRASVATILASEQEGLPRCVMESMCLGVPVIGTKIRGTQDLLSQDCGLLVKVGDIHGLTDAIAWVINHPLEARIVGERGRERMAAYDVPHIIELHEKLYAEASFASANGEKTPALANTQDA